MCTLRERIVIIDTVMRLGEYRNIPRVDAIVGFLRDTDSHTLATGDIPIHGNELYVKVLRYVPKVAEENDFEVHLSYTDVQVLIEGTEEVQMAPLDCLRPKTDRASEGDFQFFSAHSHVSKIVMRQGQFVTFFPQEPHKPGCKYGDIEIPILKLVFKAK